MDNKAAWGVYGALFCSASVLTGMLPTRFAALAALVGVHIVVVAVKFSAAQVAGPLGRVLVRCGAVSRNPFNDPRALAKWVHQAWQLAVHVLAAAAGSLLLSYTTWMQDPRSTWAPANSSTPTWGIQLFFGVQLAVWSYTLIMHVLVDERRHDFLVMTLHHFVTVALVAAAVFGGMAHGGLIVMYLHDSSDIFIDLLRMADIARLEGRRGWYASEIMYVLCVASWIGCRLVALPLHLVHGYIVLAPNVDALVNSLAHAHTAIAVTHLLAGLPAAIAAAPASLNIIYGLACLLCCMHVRWFWILARIGCSLRTTSAQNAAAAFDNREQV